MNEEDKEMLKWLKVFNKRNVRIDQEKVQPYYISLIEKTIASENFGKTRIFTSA
ncbi:hypothetical protein Syun_028218 [Stephania yunnanensis]|uniref:Inositol oxygenase n=1 Tax=Stephania yunnanensis TaxID=152371 RepID=A0AAP0EKC7_9MAGN